MGSDQPPGITEDDLTEGRGLPLLSIYTSDCIFNPDFVHPQSTPPASQPWKGTNLDSIWYNLPKFTEGKAI